MINNTKHKLIIIDYSIFVHRAIFAWRNNKQLPATYTGLNMILACLRKIGISPFDEIILACDGRGNWRKEYESEYKANRKAFRESYEDINWKEMYSNFNDLLRRLDDGTDWHVIKLDKIEADDIASVACRHFKDKEIILVSYDSDWEMLWHYGAKIFSPAKKFRGAKGAYKVPKPNFNVYKFLSKKIEKETTDNLVNPILSEKDYELRKTIVSLLELPDFVENTVIEAFENMEEKIGNIEAVPYKKLREKLGGLYNDRAKLVTYEDCVKYEEKKKAKKRRNKR